MQMQQAVFTTPHPTPLATRTNQMKFGQPLPASTLMRIWEPQAGAHKNIFFPKIITLVIAKLILKILFVWLALFLYHVGHPNQHHQQIRLTTQISKSPLVLIRLLEPTKGPKGFLCSTLPLPSPGNRDARCMILPPSQLPQSRNAISQWRPRLCQWRPRLRSRKKMKIRLGIEETSKTREKTQVFFVFSKIS